MPSDIPQIIHTMWIGPPCPPEIEEMMGTWPAHHPGWAWKVWNERNVLPLVNQDLWDRAKEISPNAPEQFRADVARYEILYSEGGVWVDADFTCQKPIDKLCEVPFAGQVGHVVNNALIGMTPRHPLMDDLVNALPENVGRFRPAEGNTLKSGPQFFTPHALRHGIREYPSDYFYPYRWDQLDRASQTFPKAYAVHRWHNRSRQWSQ